MCIGVWSWLSHPRYPLLLLLNRDEYHSRPTVPMSWWKWEDSLEVLGGRDCRAGGTWMACTSNGRVAFLTNVREPNPHPSARSRGDLPLQFLKYGIHWQSGKSPYEFALEIAEEASHYNGFNLIVVDICSKSMVYASNRPKGQPFSIQIVPPGIHCLSNAQLNTPWPKVQCLRANFKDILREYEDKEVQEDEMVKCLMRDTVKSSREELPDTGVDPKWELLLSPIFIDFQSEQAGRYGTRSTTALTVKAIGEVVLYDTYLEGTTWKDHFFHYTLQKANYSGDCDQS